MLACETGTMTAAGSRSKRLVIVLGLLAVIGASATGCSGGRRSSLDHIDLPAFAADCARPSQHLSSVIAVKQVSRSSFSDWLVAGVCVNGRGPFTFLVDTGAPYSVIDDRVAPRLHLPGRTKSVTRKSSFGCTSQLAFARVTDWSVGNMTLPAQFIGIAHLRSPVVPGLDGLLGSDVMSRFGAVRIDYNALTLTLGDKEPIPMYLSREGRTDPPAIPAALTSGTTQRIPMEVGAGQFPIGNDRTDYYLNVRPRVTVSISGILLPPFAVDTGAAVTTVTSTVAEGTHLTKLPSSYVTYAGLSCRVTVDTYRVDSWAVGAVSLSSQTIGSTELDDPAEGGLLGSGTLQNYSPVVVDYQDGELLLS